MGPFFTLLWPAPQVSLQGPRQRPLPSPSQLGLRTGSPRWGLEGGERGEPSLPWLLPHGVPRVGCVPPLNVASAPKAVSLPLGSGDCSPHQPLGPRRGESLSAVSPRDRAAYLACLPPEQGVQRSRGHPSQLRHRLLPPLLCRVRLAHLEQCVSQCSTGRPRLV